ncbi:MAG: ATP-binding cassette domain-containing protein [Planctomycetes bacterium]|nr:ATP-binding cassette domain-containing protein [Planctomycetota bacterium]
MADPVLRIERVRKCFGAHVAVDDLDFQLAPGTICGFIGPNGSGKTTTLRMVLNIIRPDAGTIELLGSRARSTVLSKVGYLPEERGLYRKMRVADVLRFFADLKGVARPRAVIDEWLQRLDLTAWARRKVEALSKGMSQKVQFIAAVIGNPELLILDEPFSGLDPVNRDALRKIVVDLRSAGVTVIFSTHDMPVAEMMCDTICMIHRGKKVLDGSLAEIQGRFAEDTIRLRADGDIAFYRSLPGVNEVNAYGPYAELRLAASADPRRILRALADHGTVHQFEITHPSLHDIFVRIAGPVPDTGSDGQPSAARGVHDS